MTKAIVAPNTPTDEDVSSSVEAGNDVFQDTNLPKEVTLTSITETGQDESTILVLKQRSYTGRKVLPSALADSLCGDLHVNGVLGQLNTTLGTSYPLDSVLPILGSYIAPNVDFGTAYAYLWPCCVPPQQVWDLYANRVVPYWVAGRMPWVISHAWVDEKDRVNVMTSINGGEWPVPMPKNANLDLIRIENLNVRSHRGLQTDYAWLDVLCLRQEGGENEHLHLDEWKLDVPQSDGCMSAQTRYFGDDRCWFRRAWTLQEITENWITGGKTGKDVMDEEVQWRFNE
ncbi:hypothetical protein EDD18DRAFT_1460280 [Armillaria luteobubalina]|uniref:Heterokaryon incompatibility domain-containing protein n=1 Tax=Armillaria luteobubalina TaxID=153913 RepID=A0AA39TSC1_9AGAR|nr:hypothetical protein EDD18DRAFT_1460280 [Armillaria luteobubalina]